MSGAQVRDEAEPGLAGLLEREHHTELAVAARVAVVAEGDGPRHGRSFVVVGRVVVERVVDGSSHGVCSRIGGAHDIHVAPSTGTRPIGVPP